MRVLMGDGDELFRDTESVHSRTRENWSKPSDEWAWHNQKFMAY